MTQIVLSNSLQSYLLQVNRLPLLTADAEFGLAKRLKDHNDLDAAHMLITSNLRFVVKIAMDYRNYGLKLADLIQEGNIGLMKAVKKFDPYKGFRLITYAVWWIRSHIQAFILKNWSLVHKEVSSLKKRLFYQLDKSNENISELEGNSAVAGQSTKTLPAESRDVSLDNEIGDNETTRLDMLPDSTPNQEDVLAKAQEHDIIREQVSDAMSALTDREKYVIEKRFMADDAATLQEIGDSLGITRERVRQIESSAMKKLKGLKNLRALAAN